MTLRNWPAIASTLFLLGLAPAAAASGQAFSTEPLRGQPAWPKSQLPRDAAGLLAWATALGNRVNADQMMAGREQIYALLAERVRRDFATTGAAPVPAPDSVLGRLIAVTDGYGVISAAPLAAALGTPISSPESSVHDIEFTLEFGSGMFALMAEHGRWRVQFPWYMMLWMADRIEFGGEPPMDLVNLSTLTAANTPPTGGASQGTIMIVSTESDDLGRFTAIWLDRLGLTPNDTTTKASPQSTRGYKRYVPEAQMHLELNAFKIPSGSLLVMYIGLDGTYQANRQHYLDLLASLRVR